jgi:predicted molibdopterin-dependent oxidoreductase YjgC
MKVIIDGKTIEAEENKTILELARENGIYIPSLCDHAELAPFSGCCVLFRSKVRKDTHHHAVFMPKMAWL